MKTISICGVDGSGKTTLLAQIASLTQAAKTGAAPVAVLRAPQYCAGNDLSIRPLAERFDGLGAVADKAGLPELKACGLFLSMTLYGAAQAELCRTSGCRVLFRERDPIADSLTYAQVYVKLLTRNLPDELAADHGGTDLDGYLGELLTREALGHARLPFAELPLYIRAVFSTPFPDVVSVLESLYGASTPDVILLLRLSPEMMRKRMALKAAQNPEQPREYHETHEVLLRLQAGMEQAIRALREVRQFEYVVWDVDDRPAHALAQELLRTYLI